MTAVSLRPSNRTLFAQLPTSFAWLWAAHPSGTLWLSLVTLVMGVVPAAMAWVG